MGIPSASYSITMRVHLGADPLGIGRITTAVGEAAGTVVAVDIVESHADLLVVKRTVRAQGGGWWVQGDNEFVTDDSRVYGVADVIGRVLVRYWPRPGRLS